MSAATSRLPPAVLEAASSILAFLSELETGGPQAFRARLRRQRSKPWFAKRLGETIRLAYLHYGGEGTRTRGARKQAGIQVWVGVPAAALEPDAPLSRPTTGELLGFAIMGSATRGAICVSALLRGWRRIRTADRRQIRRRTFSAFMADGIDHTVDNSEETVFVEGVPVSVFRSRERGRQVVPVNALWVVHGPDMFNEEELKLVVGVYAGRSGVLTKAQAKAVEAALHFAFHAYASDTAGDDAPTPGATRVPAWLLRGFNDAVPGALLAYMKVAVRREAWSARPAGLPLEGDPEVLPSDPEDGVD